VHARAQIVALLRPQLLTGQPALDRGPGRGRREGHDARVVAGLGPRLGQNALGQHARHLGRALRAQSGGQAGLDLPGRGRLQEEKKKALGHTAV